MVYGRWGLQWFMVNVNVNVYGLTKLVNGGLQWFVNQQTQLGAPSCNWIGFLEWNLLRFQSEK
jgi:hypothetical protein